MSLNNYCDLEDTSLANKAKKIPKNFWFHNKIGPRKLPPIAKVVENQNFVKVYLTIFQPPFNDGRGILLFRLRNTDRL